MQRNGNSIRISLLYVWDKIWDKLWDKLRLKKKKSGGGTRSGNQNCDGECGKNLNEKKIVEREEEVFIRNGVTLKRKAF